LQIDGLGGSYGTERLTFYKMLPQMGPPETTCWEYPRGDESWAYEIREFLRDIAEDRIPSPSLADAAKALEIVRTICRKSDKPAP
jgi:predicted dehydrogenase